jgi:glycosyltransferase involved in cell wall biosynthesis
VNDASTDNSLEEMQKFTDPRIRILHRDEPGPGGYAARNLGIQEARAEWVAFLDADDEWYPNHLAKVHQSCQNYPTATFFSSGWLIKEGQCLVKNPFLVKNEKLTVIEKIDINRYLRIHVSGIDLVHTNVAIVKKEMLEKIGGFPMPSSRCKRAGDGQTWLRVMLAGGEMLWSSHVGAVYHQDAVNMVTKKQAYTIAENGLLSFIEDFIKDKKIPHQTHQLLKKYRKKRVISALFQDARNQSVDINTVVMALKAKHLDPRLPFILLGYIFPKITQRMIRKLFPPLPTRSGCKKS